MDESTKDVKGRGIIQKKYKITKLKISKDRKAVICIATSIIMNSMHVITVNHFDLSVLFNI